MSTRRQTPPPSKRPASAMRALAFALLVVVAVCLTAPLALMVIR